MPDQNLAEWAHERARVEERLRLGAASAVGEDHHREMALNFTAVAVALEQIPAIRKQRDKELRERLKKGQTVDAVAKALSGGKGPSSYRPTAEIALRALRDSIFEETDR